MKVYVTKLSELRNKERNVFKVELDPGTTVDIFNNFNCYCASVAARSLIEKMHCLIIGEDFYSILSII